MEEIKFDFEKNLNYLLDNPLDKKISDKEIKMQNKIMNSKDFNETFQYIEEAMNFLYEKERMLQDIIKYSDLYLKNEINNSITECKTLLAAIENDRDLTKNNSYIKYAVPFNFNGGTSATDRDNSAISNTSLYDGRLSLDNIVLNSYKMNSVEIIQNFKNNNIKNTISSFILDNSYRTFYMFSGPQSTSIKEKLIVKLDNPSKVNKLTFSTSNCNIDKVTLILDDDSREEIPNIYNGLFKTRVIKSLEIEFSCTNYIKSQVNYNDLKDEDFWTTVQKIEEDQNLIVDKDKYYYYLFGIDNLQIQHVNIDAQNCFISKEVKIDELQVNEHLALDVEDSIERGSIEYNIIDGTDVIPILPENIKQVVDEKIFYKMPLRFNYDATKPILVKRNGDIVKMSLQEAINKNEKGVTYTVSYTPILNPINKLLNSKIKLKVIIRKYENDFNSFVKSINIKKYGGGKLWIDKY